jgi:cysteine synthase
MPDTMSVERRTLLAMLGAKLVLTPGTEGMKGAIARAEQLPAKRPIPGFPQQFENPANPAIHRKTTAEEIWKTPMARWIFWWRRLAPAARSRDASRSSSRARRRFRPSRSNRRIRRSFRNVWPGSRLKPGPHKIQGTGAGFIPKNLHLKDSKGHPQIVECIQVSNDDSFAMARRLAKEEGLLVGISTGANVVAAIQVAKRPENKGKMIVTVACSTGERYLSTPLAAEAKGRSWGLKKSSCNNRVLA